MYKQVELFGNYYILVGDLNDAAICTPQQYQSSQDSFAHLYHDGNIKQHGKIIGTKNDIKFTGIEVDI